MSVEQWDLIGRIAIVSFFVFACVTQPMFFGVFCLLLVALGPLILAIWLIQKGVSND